MLEKAFDAGHRFLLASSDGYDVVRYLFGTERRRGGSRSLPEDWLTMRKIVLRLLISVTTLMTRIGLDIIVPSQLRCQTIRIQQLATKSVFTDKRVTWKSKSSEMLELNTDTPLDLTPAEALKLEELERVEAVRLHRRLTNSTLKAAVAAVDFYKQKA